MQFEDKVAIITGGSRGIGRAIVEKLAAEGAAIVFTYSSSSEAAETLLDKLNQVKSRVIAVQADVNNLQMAHEVVLKAVESFGRIDILVNNAGITRDKSFMLMRPEDWRNVLDVNLTGAFNYASAVIMKMFRQKSGNIINISSYSGVFGAAGQANYSASKAGLIGFTKALAKELASYNIRVNAVAPGFIETEMIETLTGKFRQEMLKTVPLKRFGKAEEVAGAVSFLLSEEAEYITGQVIRIDGGLGI
jgi:3-oxoacyl-[acyl-carrier protein] reductase